MRISDTAAETGADHDGAGGRGQRHRLIALAAALALCACGGGEPEAQAPVRSEGPEDQILRVGTTWEARWAEQGFLTAPSPIALFDTRAMSRLKLAHGAKTAKETLSFDGTFKLQNGAAYACQAQHEGTVSVTFGERAGEAAVEITRAALRMTRNCDKTGFPEPVLALPESRARFALRGDKLVSFDPPTERREYLPSD